MDTVTVPPKKNSRKRKSGDPLSKGPPPQICLQMLNDIYEVYQPGASNVKWEQGKRWDDITQGFF